MMATGIEVEGPARPAGRWQVSLADLILLVVGAGLATWLVRGRRTSGEPIRQARRRFRRYRPHGRRAS